MLAAVEFGCLNHNEGDGHGRNRHRGHCSTAPCHCHQPCCRVSGSGSFVTKNRAAGMVGMVQYYQVISSVKRQNFPPHVVSLAWDWYLHEQRNQDAYPRGDDQIAGPNVCLLPWRPRQRHLLPFLSHHLKKSDQSTRGIQVFDGTLSIHGAPSICTLTVHN